ncbi:hypothetical protein TELCIR_24841 [Teladorsagia circumcincta]|uniref:Uncharacterized protein n=1 Tax=Teladorsagia circumcincta TaxID=45464 RepID=A0A2G9T8S9_TELCI|nr:hypothetical protein TELCIR_24841 [Teladorsagia circumcincta]
MSGISYKLLKTITNCKTTPYPPPPQYGQPMYNNQQPGYAYPPGQVNYGAQPYPSQPYPQQGYAQPGYQPYPQQYPPQQPVM